LARALNELEAAGIEIACASHLYKTEPLGSGRQPSYLNAVVVAKPGMPPGSLLRLAKQIERRAGRRSTPPMRSRPLDIDILDYGGGRLNWPAGRRERGRLILPHPLLHTRAFVLVPLLEVAPHWSHPVLGLPARTLMSRLGRRAAAGVVRADPPAAWRTAR
jgi:2-amino-4-hydroxy-6-hydroxymethyldihydropteridine diphosphokinase